MKGAHALPILLACAVAAGATLYYGRSRSETDPPPVAETTSAEQFVQQETGLAFDELPGPFPVSQDDLTALVGAHLDQRFGPDGLTHRSRAFDLLQLLPPGENLRGLYLAMHTAGARAWFNNQDGAIYVVDSFDPARTDDHATLARMRTRQLLHQRFPPPEDHPGDDAWIAREAVHAGIAASVQARFVTRGSGRSSLPTSEETEREATLLGLPVFVHNLAQLGSYLGRDFAEAHRQDGPEPWKDLLASPQPPTLLLLANDHPATAPPTLPDTPGTPVFEESLGAYPTQLLLERLTDYLQSEKVSPLWRGDRYRLFTTGTGDHLVWVCQWATPEAAGYAADLIRNTLSPTPADPALGLEPRHTAITTTGTTLLFLNCADAATLDSITNHQ